MVKTTRIEIFSSTHEGLSAVGIAFCHKQLEKQTKYTRPTFSDIGHQEAFGTSQGCDSLREGKHTGRDGLPILLI